MAVRSETKLVTLKIDDTEVTVPAGTYILQAAEAAGIQVPNLCYQPLLRPWGSCRLCTVEILGPRGGLIESCATPVREGMEVSTLSPEVVASRQFVLQMYLIDHALDCPTCDKSGECYLQDNTYLHNVNANPYRRPKIAMPYRHLSDLIDYKWDRCIICARCTRVCDEMIGVTAISVLGRGLEASIGPTYGVDLSETTCTNCGMCIAVCPVGALTDRHFAHHPWELDATETTCGLCDAGCTLNIEHNRGLVRRVTHLWDRGMNQGYTCERGKWGHEHVQHPDRLRYPTIREGDDFLDVEHDEAIDVVVNQLQHYQGESFAALITPDATNEEAYALQRFTRAVMGSNNIDRLVSPSQLAVEDALERSFGTPASTAGIREAREDGGCILVVGPNIGDVAPVPSYWLYWALRYRETKFVVVSADHFPLADRSDHWIRPRPGDEGAVLRAMAKIVVDEGLTAPGVDVLKLKASLASVDISQVAASAGVTSADLRNWAILYATGGQGRREGATQQPASAIWHTLSMADSPGAGEAAIAADNLALICGMIGRPGGGVLAFRVSANAQGTLDVGCSPKTLPGGRVDDAGYRTSIGELWSQGWNPEAVRQNGFKPVRELPTKPGVGIRELADAIRSKRVRAMYIAAQSHQWSLPIDDELLAAMRLLDFLVVEDAFDSALTSIAHVVLPTTMYLEKDGSFTSADRSIQRVRKAANPPGDARSTVDYLNEISGALGYGASDDHPHGLMEQIAAIVPQYSGISFPRLERGGLQWPLTQFGASQGTYLSPERGLDAASLQIVAD